MRNPWLFVILLIFPIWCFAAVPTISVIPEKVIQGEPLKIVVENVSAASSVRGINFDGQAVAIILYQGKPSALVGIDLNKKPGLYKIMVTLSNGTKLEKIITVGKREKVESPLGIPEKLGGNTPEAAKRLVNSLTKENQSIYAVRTISKQLWTDSFRFPIAKAEISDPYGYTRQTVGYSIAHKGTDFKAAEGAVVSAMNRGIVRLAKTYQIYGKTIIVDHGFGLQTLYMHLSKITVNEGELVKRGQIVGLSGGTGYVESPHLHVSVWLNKVSIDPIKFITLFQ